MITLQVLVLYTFRTKTRGVVQYRISVRNSSSTQISEISIVHNICLSCLIVLKFCTEHAVMLPCSVQNFNTIGLLKRSLLANEILRDTDFWSIAPLGSNFNKTLINMHKTSFREIYVDTLPARCQPFCSGLDVLTHRAQVTHMIYARPSLLLIMACHLFGDDPVSESTLAYWTPGNEQINQFSYKMSSTKRQPFSLGLNHVNY